MIIAARQIKYDEVTDIREYIGGGPADAEEIQALNDLREWRLAKGEWKILGPIRGWIPYTHTLRAQADEGLPPVYYHVTLTPDETPFEVGDRVEVVREPGHRGSHVCYRRKVGTVVQVISPSSYKVEFVPPVRPGLVIDQCYFGWKQLREVE